jgi:hypothetical protein
MDEPTHLCCHPGAEDAVSVNFVRGADYWAKLPTAEAIETRLHALDDQQLLTVMKVMDAKLASRPVALQQLIRRANERETGAKVAETILSM